MKTFYNLWIRFLMTHTTQPVQICELEIYVLEQKKKILHFHLKMTMFYSREKLNYLPGSINLMFHTGGKPRNYHEIVFNVILFPSHIRDMSW